MSWESSFKIMISKIRLKELSILKRFSFLNAFSAFSWTLAPFMVNKNQQLLDSLGSTKKCNFCFKVAFVSFTVFIFGDSENILDTEKAFTSLAIFKLLKQPLTLLPINISSMIQVDYLNSEKNRKLNIR